MARGPSKTLWFRKILPEAKGFAEAKPKRTKKTSQNLVKFPQTKMEPRNHSKHLLKPSFFLRFVPPPKRLEAGIAAAEAMPKATPVTEKVGSGRGGSEVKMGMDFG